LTDEQAIQPGITEPFFTFFMETCKHPIKYLTSVIKPEICQNVSISEFLEIAEPLETLLHIEDIGFDRDDNPIFYSNEYLAGEASSLHVIRQVEIA
jgi:DNA-binding GntR family transcriptional regulator